MKIIFLLSFSLFLTVTSFGQLEKTIHQTFEIGEVSTINLDLVGEVTIVPWAGNSLMTETQIQLFDASPSILNHLIEKKQRYLIDLEISENTAQLNSHDKQREAIRTRNGACTETVTVRVFLPDSFEPEQPGSATYVKKSKSN